MAWNCCYGLYPKLSFHSKTPVLHTSRDKRNNQKSVLYRRGPLCLRFTSNNMGMHVPRKGIPDAKRNYVMSWVPYTERSCICSLILGEGRGGGGVPTDAEILG